MIVLPIDSKKEKVTRVLCDLRNKKVLDSGGYDVTYEESYKMVWDNLMTVKQKRGYSFKQIYEYMYYS